MLSGPPVTGTLSPDQLLDRFLAASPRQRRTLLRQIDQRVADLLPLVLDRLDSFDATGDDWAAGCLIQMLARSADVALWESFQARYPEGWLATSSGVGIDYTPLQRHLTLQEFEEADRITSSLLRRLAGAQAEKRGYVYYSEVPAMPDADLETLDRLWVCFSRGRFGFSVQGRLLQACGGQWDRLWPRLGWKDRGIWTRYPGSFTWSLEAPEGHMPLINQLRGVRLMDALLRHPSLARRIAGSAAG